MIPSEESVPVYRWVVIGALTSGVATALGVIFFIGLLLPDISDDLGLSPSEQGWLGSSVIFGNLIFAIPANLWLSRYRPKRVAGLSFLGIAFFTLVQAASPNFAILIVGRIGVGLSFIANQAPRALIIQQWSPRRRLPFTQGVIFGSIDLVMGVLLMVTPPLMEGLGGWRSAMYAMSGMAFLTAIVWMILGKERETGEFQARLRSQTKSPLLSVLKHKRLWVMGLGMSTAMVAQSAFQTFWPTFAQDGLGASATVTGLVLGVMTIAAAPTDFLANAVPALVRRQPFVLVVCGLATTGSYVGLLYLDSTALMLLMSVVRGMFFAFFPVLMIMVYQLPAIKPREIAVGVAFMQTSIWAGAGVGPLLVGFMQEATGDLRFALFITGFTPLLLVVAGLIMQAQAPEAAQRVTVARGPEPEA